MTASPNHSSPPGLIPALLLNDTSVDRHHGCSRVVRTVRFLAQRAGIEIKAAVPAHTDWLRDPAYAQCFDGMRLVIVNGEGSIHHDRPQGRLLLEAGTRARQLGIPAALINSSWQANGAALTDKLRDFSLVAIRDTHSAAEVRHAGIGCRTVPDLSLYFEPPAAETRQGIGVTDGVLRNVGLELESLRRRVDGICVPIQYSDPGAMGLLRFVRGYVGKSDLKRPLALTRVVAARLRQYYGQSATDEEFIRQIAGLQLLVSGRFHAATFAAAARTPFLAVRPPEDAVETDGYKLAGLIQGIGLESWRLTSSGAISDALLRRAASWHGDEAIRLQAYLHKTRGEIVQLFQDIRQLAEPLAVPERRSNNQ